MLQFKWRLSDSSCWLRDVKATNVAHRQTWTASVMHLNLWRPAGWLTWLTWVSGFTNGSAVITRSKWQLPHVDGFYPLRRRMCCQLKDNLYKMVTFILSQMFHIVSLGIKFTFTCTWPGDCDCVAYLNLIYLSQLDFLQNDKSWI